MVITIKLPLKSYVVCSHIDESCDIGKPFFYIVLEHFAFPVILGFLVSAVAHFLSLKARNSVKFQRICKILVSKK